MDTNGLTDTARFMAGLDDRPAPADVRFGPAPGNVMAHAWAEHMMALWFQAGTGKLSFSDAVKATAAHFMLAGQ